MSFGRWTKRVKNIDIFFIHKRIFSKLFLRIFVPILGQKVTKTLCFYTWVNLILRFKSAPCLIRGGWVGDEAWHNEGVYLTLWNLATFNNVWCFQDYLKKYRKKIRNNIQVKKKTLTLPQCNYTHLIICSTSRTNCDLETGIRAYLIARICATYGADSSFAIRGCRRPVRENEGLRLFYVLVWGIESPGRSNEL